MFRPLAFAALLVVPSAVPLAAQLTEVQAGTRVRIEAPGIVPGRDYVARVVTRTADTLVIGGPNTIPLSVPFVGIRESVRIAGVSDGMSLTSRLARRCSFSADALASVSTSALDTAGH